MINVAISLLLGFLSGIIVTIIVCGFILVATYNSGQIYNFERLAVTIWFVSSIVISIIAYLYNFLNV